jgi:catechol 2,3-dioxygenase-like lactoylglutathione lyase family enzyme
MTRPDIDQQITFLSTRDLDGTGSFYEDVLGLELALDQGDCRIYRVCEGAFVGFCQRAAAPDVPVGVILTLVTADVDAWYEYLVHQGVVPDKAPMHNTGYGIYHFFLRDPNGYLIEVQRFDDLEWSTGGRGRTEER